MPDTAIKPSGRSIVVKSADKRLVYGEVYIPYMVDTDNEAMTPEAIEKAAHNFLAKNRTDKIDVDHNRQESGVVVVESFIARKNDPDNFIEGSWVLGVKIIPDEIWEAVKKGEINAFSLYGMTTKTPATAVVSMIRMMEGYTEDSLGDVVPPHSHYVMVSFDDIGNVIPGYTEEKLDHKHKVLKASATTEELGHSHRMVIV